MSHLEYDGEILYKYAMNLFVETGHVATRPPEFCNHSAERFVFFDNDSKEISLTGDQRNALTLFNNVSRLFNVNGSTFFSINLSATCGKRSQTAHDIHTMIHPLVGTDGTVCVFLYEDNILLSFMGFGYHCVMSDWFSIADDMGRIYELLDIANISIRSNKDYFLDMVYMLARPYYGETHDFAAFSLIPINAASLRENGQIDREDINQMIKEQLEAAKQQYSDDYVEYDVQGITANANIEADIDLMVLELDMEEANPFGEEMEQETETEEEYEDEYCDGESEDDDYDIESLDPELFSDPALMVKWLEKRDQPGRENRSV